MRVSGGLFGVGASVDAVAQAERRQARRAPARASCWKALRLTLFSDPHVYVEGVGAQRDDGPARAELPRWRCARGCAAA